MVVGTVSRSGRAISKRNTNTGGDIRLLRGGVKSGRKLSIEKEGIISGKITVNQRGQRGIYLGLICQSFRG